MVTLQNSCVPPLVPPDVPRDHPVVTREYSLFTASIDEMVERVAAWLDDQVDGGTVYGPSRFGKSNAVDHWLQRLLSERHGGYVPLVVWSHTDASSANSVGRFYAHLLAASGHRLAFGQRPPLAKQTMLMERWIQLAHQGGGRFLVLVIDEAQGMTQREWLWLVELHSLLEKEHIRVCVVSIASLQFFDEPISMALAGGAHVAARFMLNSAPFHGIRNAGELAYVMRGYDDGSEWPSGSGRSYSAGLAPKAWQAGFRMAEHADNLWKALIDTLPKNYLGPEEFPMRTVAHVCRHVLLRIAGGADIGVVTHDQAWKSVVSESGHATLMAIVSATARRRGIRPEEEHRG